MLLAIDYVEIDRESIIMSNIKMPKKVIKCSCVITTLKYLDPNISIIVAIIKSLEGREGALSRL